MSKKTNKISLIYKLHRVWLVPLDFLVCEEMTDLSVMTEKLVQLVQPVLWVPLEKKVLQARKENRVKLDNL